MRQNMNAAATMTNLAHSLAPVADQNNHGHQAATNLIGHEQNPISLYSDLDTIEQRLSARRGSSLHSSMMVEAIQNPNISYNSNGHYYQLCSDKTLDEMFDQEQQCVQIYGPAPAPPNPITTSCFNNYDVASLIPSNGSTTANDDMSFEQDQLFLSQSCIRSFTKNDVIIQKPEKRRRSDPSGEDVKNQRVVKKRNASARWRARKLARSLEMENELRQIREENEKLKKKLVEMKSGMKKGGEKLRRTKSWA